jgi:hypothetical protein
MEYLEYSCFLDMCFRNEFLFKIELHWVLTKTSGDNTRDCRCYFNYLVAEKAKMLP